MKPSGQDSKPQKDPGGHNIRPAIPKPSKIEWALSGDVAIPKPSKIRRARQARRVHPSDLSAPGAHDISPATPKPPKVRQATRVRKQEEPNWALLFWRLFAVIVAVLAIMLGTSGAFVSGSGGRSHTSHSRR